MCAAREVALAVCDHLFDERLGVAWQESLRVPSCDRPLANWHIAMHHHRYVNARTWNLNRRGNHSNAMASLGQCDQRLRGNAFEQHARPNMSNLARGLKPTMRGKA